MKENPDINRIISYTALRRAVGILGIALPIVLAAGAIIMGDCKQIQPSISLYYNTIMRNVFVGILCGVALFMFAYRGYDYRDRIAGISAFIFALGIAFFPASGDITRTCDIISVTHFDWVRGVHLTSAILFFLTLSYFSLFLFTRTTDGNKENHTLQKKQRNKLYRTCGFIMLGSLLLIFLYMIKPDDILPDLYKYHPAFWLETVALFAFGISWLVKGQAILKDKQII
ncbi:MAG: hypothetical protein K8R54_17640 [Bacteroidales bacterium]|nr:hypothetical protein [Bacteroidales bacterium]